MFLESHKTTLISSLPLLDQKFSTFKNCWLRKSDWVCHSSHSQSTFDGHTMTQRGVSVLLLCYKQLSFKHHIGLFVIEKTVPIPSTFLFSYPQLLKLYSDFSHFHIFCNIPYLFEFFSFSTLPSYKLTRLKKKNIVLWALSSDITLIEKTSKSIHQHVSAPVGGLPFGIDVVASSTPEPIPSQPRCCKGIWIHSREVQ